MIVADIAPQPDPLAQYAVWWLLWTWPFLLAGAVFWGAMFLKLMAMRDDAFPGRHDKVLWFAALLALCCW